MAKADEETDDLVGLKRALAGATERLREERKLSQRLMQDLEIAERRAGIVGELRAHKPSGRIIPRCKTSSGEACAIAVASDWHVEESVDPSTINGLNSYDLEIADARAQRFWQKALRMTELARAGVKVKQIVVGLLGDLMTGYIHEELVESNNLSPTETVLWLYERITRGLDMLLDHGGFERILVVCCPGNHGRTTPKKRVSTGYKNSFEWLLYRMLALHYRTTGRIQFQIANGILEYVDVLGTRVRFTHGDHGINYSGGIGGLTVGLRKAHDAWNHQDHADITICGHWHQLVDYGYAVVNGSLIGYGPYAQSIKARFERPQQAWLLIDKDHGKTMFAPLFVE
jgi:hypothetical protein